MARISRIFRFNSKESPLDPRALSVWTGAQLQLYYERTRSSVIRCFLSQTSLYSLTWIPLVLSKRTFFLYLYFEHITFTNGRKVLQVIGLYSRNVQFLEVKNSFTDDCLTQMSVMHCEILLYDATLFYLYVAGKVFTLLEDTC